MGLGIFDQPLYGGYGDSPWEREMKAAMMQNAKYSQMSMSAALSQLRLHQALTGQTIPIALGTKLQHICPYCKMAHDKQFCPGCGASKEGKP